MSLSWASKLKNITLEVLLVFLVKQKHIAWDEEQFNMFYKIHVGASKIRSRKQM